MTWPHDEEDTSEDNDIHDEHPRTNIGRITPGEIRNPAGRPTGSRNRGKIIRKVAMTKHAITENGRRRQRPSVEIVLLTVRGKALKGDTRAMKLLDGLQLRFSRGDAVPPRAVLIVGEKLSEEGLAEELARMRAEQLSRDLAREGASPPSGDPPTLMGDR